MRAPLTNPVRYLRELYAVVLGVAFVLAVEDIIDTGRVGDPILWQHLPLFGAFTATAVSFFHGTALYLDVTYTETPSRGRVFSDILIGLLELFLLIALAGLITRPVYFALAFAVLLALDVVRVGFVRVLSRKLPSLDRTLILVNTGALVALLAGLGIIAAIADGSVRDNSIRWFSLALSLGRAAILYSMSFDLLFPSASSESPGTL